MSAASQKGCRNVRIWSYIVAGIHMVITFLAIILLIAIMTIYHRDDIQADKSADSLASTPLSGFIVAFLIAVWSFVSAGLMIRGIKVKRANFILPFLFWNALVIIVSIFGAIVDFIIDLVHKQPIGSVMINFIMEFAVTVLLFLMLVPVVLYYNDLKTRPISIQLRSA